MTESENQDNLLGQFLKENEDAWTFEKKGSNRIIEARVNGWVGHILGTRSHPVHYVNAIGGEGNHPHKWGKKKIKKEMWNDLIERGLV